MYSLYYKGLSLGVTFQVKHLCVGDFASFAKIFAGFYFGRGIVIVKGLREAVEGVDRERAEKSNQLNRSLTLLAVAVTLYGLVALFPSLISVMAN